MLYYDFMDYEDFKERFGIIHHGNGTKNRKNKILLAYIKNKDLLHKARVTNDYSLLHISSMSELKQVMMKKIQDSGIDKRYPVRLINDIFMSDQYSTDDNLGLCEDGDFKSVRYMNMTNKKIYKMKAGKFLRAIILETEFGQTLPEQVLGYLCEEFTQDFQTYAMGTLPKNQLVVSDEFEKIYSSECCKGDFGSCMVDRRYHYFYQDAVDASAAYLIDEKGMIIARCVIYNNVHDQDENIYRLAERQYSSGSSDVLKRALVDALIREDKIDGYKKVGAGCGDATEFVDTKGNSLSDRQFWIDCDLETYDTLSYQDSFKWYSLKNRKAYNYQAPEAYDNLDRTEGSIDGDDEDDENYDEYHDCYTAYDTVTVLYDGREMSCAENRLDDFTWCEGEDLYVYTPETAHCDTCDYDYIKENGIYSEITGEYYCCANCKETAEKEYKEENWYWSEYDHEYYEDEDDITELWQWKSKERGYVACTISKKTLTTLVIQNKCFIVDDEAYDKLNGRNNLPFYYKKRNVA